MNTKPHRTEHGAARVQALTEAATELFLQRGMDGVSVDELIQQVGGSRRNIYDRFGGKEGLFIKVVTQLCDRQAAPLRDMEIGDGELAPALLVFGERLLEIVLQPRTLALHRLMIADGQRFPDLSRAVLASGHDAGVAVLAAWFSERGDIFQPDLSLEILAEHFVTLLVTKAQRDALMRLAATDGTPLIRRVVALSGALRYRHQVSKVDFDRFVAEHVSIGSLAADLGRSKDQVFANLQLRGVSPIPCNVTPENLVYQRADL